MARIRTIKPEFPQSESMGRISRDARLLFVMLWPICDDHGRTRAASRMLASLLFPYDTDATGLIDGWLDELEREQCIRRYSVGTSTYLEVCNWLIHQRIDKPSKPQFPEPSANTREDSRVVEEPSPLEGKGRERKGKEGSGAVEACPHDDIIEIYHATLPTNPKIKTWTDQRRANLRTRWREDPKRQTIDYWQRLFDHVAASRFLTGRDYSKDRRPFFAGLDWIVKPENFAKIIEGRYNDEATQ